MVSFEYYKNSNKNYKNNGDIKIPFLYGTLTFETNSTNEIEIEIPYDEFDRWKQIERFGIIKIKVPYIKNKQLYRIYDLEKDMLSYKIKARHIFYDLIDNILLDNRPTNCDCETALNNILTDTGFTGQSNIRIGNTAYYINKNCIQAICGDIDQSIINRWGGEILQDNFKVIINDRLGANYGVKIKYGLNIENVSLDDSTDNICTRIYPLAFNGIMLPEKFVDSPIINNYPKLKCNFVSMEDLRLKDKETIQEEELKDDTVTYFDTENELYTAMRKRCNTLFAGGLDKPNISGTVNMIALENTLEYADFKELVNVGIGDTVTVEHKDIGINIETRCVGFEYNLVTEKYNKIELGSIQQNYFYQQSDIQNTVNNILNKTNGIIGDDGYVKAEKIRGTINANNAQMQVMRNVATDSPVKAILFEDNVKDSPTYGAMALGTMGFMIANKRTLDDKDWDWQTFGNGSGFTANLIKTGKLVGDNTSIDLDTGVIESIMNDGSKVIINPAEGFYNEFGDSKNEYYHLSYAGEVGFTSTQIKTIQLPDEFKGKNFKIMVFPKRLDGANNQFTDGIGDANHVLTEWGINFDNTSAYCNYEAGTFQAYMYSTFLDLSSRTFVNANPIMGFLAIA